MKYGIATCLLSSIFLLFIFFKPANKTYITVQNNSQGFAVVELFTSEGCSSCPPADIAVASLLKESPQHVYVLGFHVDYWNNLGWKDVYSKTSFTNRQRNYASAFKLNSIYTPQIVVNGSKQFVGSNKSALYNSVKDELNKSTQANIILLAASRDDKHVTVQYTSPKIMDAEVVNFALVQKQAISNVKRGENAGNELHHVNVVRDFISLKPNLHGEVQFTIPDNLPADDFTIIAFTQNKKSMQITSAAEALIK